MDMVWDGLSLALAITELIHCCGVRQRYIRVPGSGGTPAPLGFSGSFAIALTQDRCSLCLLDNISMTWRSVASVLSCK